MTARYLNMAGLHGREETLAEAFRSASPFPHLVADGVLNLPGDAMDHFPGPEWPYWEGLGDAYQAHKVSASDIAAIPEPFAGLIREASEPQFLAFLERLTGIGHLIPDPYLSGGGLHMSGPGGVLGLHTDFHLYRRLNLFRRINVIFYLNENWAESDGGELTLVQDKVVRKIAPEMGRMAVFVTDDRSVHGFPTPVANGRWRRSVALYYYTARDSHGFGGDETTYWREHGPRGGLLRRLRLSIYHVLLQTSRLISALAHLVNPNQGVGLLRTWLDNRANARRRTGR